MYVRQCISCSVIDARETFDDEQSASRIDDWRCEHCGGTAFEPVVMAEEEPTGEIADEFE
jgi:hypothetical protein